jgi:hypothetical protein
MTVAAGAAPHSRSASFRNLDRQISIGADRHGQDGCVGRRRKAEGQRRAKRTGKSNSTYHRSLPHLQVNAPSHRFSNRRGAKLASKMTKTMTDLDRTDPQPFISLNEISGALQN